jgi:hypothetical protein
MEPDVQEKVMELARIASTGMLWHCLCAISRLEIPDIIADKSLPVSEIAALAGVKDGPLLRVLRFIADHGIVGINGDSVRLTDAGELLFSGHPASMWAVFAATGAADVAHALTGSIRTGRPAADEVLGMAFWDYLAAHPAEQKIFDGLMRRHIKGLATTCIPNLEWPEYGTVADIGGGVGAVLAAALNTSPGLRGILIDQSQVLENAHDYLRDNGVFERCELRCSGLFAPIPEADVYILSFVLHDWDDLNAERILLAVGQNARPGSALRIFEHLIPDDGTPNESKRSDVSMLLLTGGRERTLAEFESLLVRTGWQLEKASPAYGTAYVIQGRRIEGSSRDEGGHCDDALL